MLDQGQADTEHQSSDVKQIIWLEGVVNVREHKKATLHSMFPLYPRHQLIKISLARYKYTT